MNLICLILLMGLTLSVAIGAERNPIAIRYADPKPGDRVKVSESEQIVTTTTFAGQNAPPPRNDNTAKVLVYVDECIIAPESAGAKPLKMTRTFERIEGAQNGKPFDHEMVGKKILIEKKDGQYVFTTDKGPVAGVLAEVLHQSFNKPGIKSSDLVPATPVKAGDSWDIDTKKLLVTVSADTMTFDVEKSKSTGRLLTLYSVHDLKYGEIEVTSTIPITGLGPQSPLKVKPSSNANISTIVAACIDGQSPAGESVMKMNIKIDASIPGPDGANMDLSIVTELKQTTLTERLAAK